MNASARSGFLAAAIVAVCSIAGEAGAQAADPGEADFRTLYKELIEINTTRSAGNCTQAAEAMRKHLLAAGYPAEDLQILAPPEAPKDGALVAVLRGSDETVEPILLLAHIDVVEAKREDWTRDPFKLVEEDGWFYARGASDDKSMAAIFTDSLIRYRKEGYRPRRDIKLALTCGEETAGAGLFDSVRWLVQTQPDVLSAAFAINEGAGGEYDRNGNLRHQYDPRDNHVEYTWDELNRAPGECGPVPSVINGRFRNSASVDVNPITWHVLADRGVTVRGPNPLELDVWDEPESLRDWSLGSLDEQWRRWREKAGRLVTPRGLAVLGSLAPSWSVLSVSRLHFTLKTGEITSKSGAGAYALHAFPERWQRIVNECLRVRRGAQAPSLYESALARRRAALDETKES